MNVISGGSDSDQQRDGDFLTHDQRYARTDEYVNLLKRLWTASGAVDHEGEFCRFKGASSNVHTFQQPHLPIYFSGASPAGIEIAARHADTYMLWGEPLEDFATQVRMVRAPQSKWRGRWAVTTAWAPAPC